MATNFRVKVDEIGLFTFICRLGIPKLSGISQFKRFICDDLATSYKNLVRFGPATVEFKQTISSLATFAWRRRC